MGALKSVTTNGAVTTVWNTPTPVKRTVADSFADPLYNKFVVIGVLVFFVTILILIILVHVIRILRHKYSRPTLFSENGDTRSLDDSLAGEDDDDDLVDLYTSCHLYVDDPEVNTASASDLDCVSVAEGERDSFVNELKETERPEYLEQSRSLLSRHFQKR